jgi:hypothetical protein
MFQKTKRCSILKMNFATGMVLQFNPREHPRP